MGFKVKIIRNDFSKEVKVDEGANLLTVIRGYVNDFYAPCGGNGTCGKCRVFIPGDGHVTSCLFHVNKDIEVILPDKKEMNILSLQYKLTKTVIPKPGKLENSVAVPYGLAVDIGTTTMVFYIVNLLFGSVVDIKTAVNPQIKYGADVISRIQYGMENENGIKDLQIPLIKTINNVINEYCEQNGIINNDFVRITITGNTTMLHTFLGEDATSIAQYPFIPVFKDVVRKNPKDLFIDINTKGEIVLLPSLSGYIGADIVAGLASLDMKKIGKTFLYVDIGTNGEIVLVTPERVLSCATAAGPAFEGANISCGMSAVAGAVSEYSVNEIKVIGNAEPKGVCGSGLIDIVAEMLKTGALQQEGNIEKDFVVYQNEHDNHKITLTQQDIREVQLAKSAIAAGINRLLSIAGITKEQLDNVLLAGGFGNYINVKNAIRIGLLPDVPFDKYIQIGNSAGSGAVLALLSEDFINTTVRIRDNMEYIELSTDTEFPMEYAMNMYF